MKPLLLKGGLPRSKCRHLLVGVGKIGGAALTAPRYVPMVAVLPASNANENPKIVLGNVHEFRCEAPIAFDSEFRE